MQRTVGRRLLRPYACHSCLAHQRLARQTILPWTGNNWGKATGFASVQVDGATATEDISAAPLRPIRERLREYAETELTGLTPRPVPRDYARVGATENSLTRVESQNLVEIDGEGVDGTDGDIGRDDQLLGEGFPGIGDSRDGDCIVSPARPYGAVAPQPGDLIEVSTDSWRVQLLAVCLGNFRGIDHFYTNTGRWFASAGGVRSLFGVAGFASAAELEPIIAALPEGCLPGENLANSPNTNAVTDTVNLDNLLDRLQELRQGPSREAGAGLIRKMNAFMARSGAIHRAYAAVLDNAFPALQQALTESSTDVGNRNNSSTEPQPSYMALDEIASVLLRREGHKMYGKPALNEAEPCPPLREKGKKDTDKFTPEALYAVHRAIVSDDMAFRPLTANTGAPRSASTNDPENNARQSRFCLFSVSLATDVDAVLSVERTVREFYENPMRVMHGGRMSFKLLQELPLGQFVLRARAAIDRSREIRRWLPYGMVGVEGKTRNYAAIKKEHKEKPLAPWTVSDQRILQFMHLWSSFQRFSSASRLHWVGASVLRAMERYGDAEYLTPATGWTFLQEVGWVAPWDLSARYSMALPDVVPQRSGGLLRGAAATTDPKTLLAPDVFAGRRHTWKTTTYCIDASSAADIDDGVSVERIPDNADEFWVHVHVADPASCIRPGSPLAQLAERLPQTVYLPGFEEPMFPQGVVRERFSLAPGRPCLTFSARVDRRDGAVRETKITPGQLGHVVFITPEDVATVITDTEAAAIRSNKTVAQNLLQPPAHLELPGGTAAFAVGVRPKELTKKKNKIGVPEIGAHGHPMTTAAGLTADGRADLEALTQVATALRAVRLANGAMPLYWPRPSVEVSLATTSVAGGGIDVNSTEAESSLEPLKCSGDPYIRIWYEGMAGAGSSASAGSRLVESLMRLAGETAADWCHERGIAVPFRGQPDAARHLDHLRTLTRDHIYPALSAGTRPPEAALRALRRLLGADDIVAEAVPHVTMGATRYVKATSPLRRYADLVAHWQIEAAIQGETADRPPLSPSDFDRNILPLLRVRERTLRALDNRAGRDQWMLQALVRAWSAAQDVARNAGHPDVLARPFDRLRFTVTHVNTQRGVVLGRLDWFERSAVMEATGLNHDGGMGTGDEETGLPLVRFDEVVPGQVYPVVLEHIDVHGNRVLVRRTGPAEDR